MSIIGVKCGVSRSTTLVFCCFLSASIFVSAKRSLKPEALLRGRETHESNSNSNSFLRISQFSWRSDQFGYQHVWPEMIFGWKIVVGTIFGFFGAAFGSICGVGGGSIFVPVLILLVGFDAKSATAMSKCMIMGAAISTVFRNINQRHPTIDVPLIDYELALLIQPMLLLGISIGVTFNIIFADWMLMGLLVILCLVVSLKAFFKGVETWKKETMMRKETVGCSEADGTYSEGMEYEILPGSPSTDSDKEAQVTILDNVYCKKFGLLAFVWVAFLLLQITKNHAAICSTLYWTVNLLQIPISIGVSLYEATCLYKGWSKIQSNGNTSTDLKVHQLICYCFLGLLTGIAGGLLGVGGVAIMGPLFLQLGAPPQVSSATATFAMMFSSSMSVLEYYLLKRFPIPYTLYFVVVAIVATFLGQRVVKSLIILLRRASLIIFILAFTVFVSALSLGGFGVSNMIEKFKRDEYMGFQNLCKYDA